MEQEPQVIPKIDLFPRVAAVGRFLGSLIRHLPEAGYHSDHRQIPEAPRPGEVGAVPAHPTLFEM